MANDNIGSGAGAETPAPTNAWRDAALKLCDEVNEYAWLLNNGRTDDMLHQRRHLVQLAHDIREREHGYEHLAARASSGSGVSRDTEVTDVEVSAFTEAYFKRGPSEDFEEFASPPNIRRRVRRALNALLAYRAGSGERPEPSEAWGEPVQFVCDDGDTGDGLRLQIMPGGNGDWYVGIVQPGDRMAIRGVRIATSGGAASTVPRLGPAIADAYRAMLAAAGKSRGTVILPTREPAPASPNSGASGSTRGDDASEMRPRVKCGVCRVSYPDGKSFMEHTCAADAGEKQALAAILTDVDAIAARNREIAARFDIDIEADSVSPASGDAGSETPAHRCNICGGCVTYDGTPPSIDYSGAGRAARVSRDGGTPPTNDSERLRERLAELRSEMQEIAALFGIEPCNDDRPPTWTNGERGHPSLIAMLRPFAAAAPSLSEEEREMLREIAKGIRVSFSSCAREVALLWRLAGPDTPPTEPIAAAPTPEGTNG